MAPAYFFLSILLPVFNVFPSIEIMGNNIKAIFCDLRVSVTDRYPIRSNNS